VLADVDFTAAKVAAEAAAPGLDVTCVALDVTDRAFFADLVDELIRTMGVSTTWSTVLASRWAAGHTN